MLNICECWLINKSLEPVDVQYLDKDRQFRKPTTREIADTHYVSTEQALDRAVTVCKTMCGLRVCFENYPDIKTNPDGHYGDRMGKRLSWIKRHLGEGYDASCPNCRSAQNEAEFMDRPTKERAR